MAGLIVGYAQYKKEKTQLVLHRKEPLVLPTQNVKKHVLSNGMNVLIFENHSIPKVLVQIAYDIGSAVEASGERGLAHLLEHMIFKGTDTLSEGDIDSIARKLGATFNAFTSEDKTSYYFEVNSSNWKPFVGILADCMQNTRFDDQHLASEVKAVIAELKMGKDNYWRLMMETACELAFPSNHPYHFPIIGFKEDLLDISGEKLKHFYKKYYNPNHATLFVVGDVNSDEVIEEVKKQFDAIPAPKEVAQTNHFPHHSNAFMAHKTTLYRDVVQPLLGFYWVVPGQKEHKETTVQTLEFLLGGGEGSRLYRRLVDEEKVASSVECGAWGMMEQGIFLVLVTPRNGQLERIKTIVAEELSKVIEHGITPFELSKVVSNKQRELLQTFESYLNFTYRWIDSFFATRNELDVFNQVNEFASLSNDDIKLFAQQHLSPLMMNEIQILSAPDNLKPQILENQAREDALDQEILNKYVRTAPIEEPKAANLMKDANPITFAFPHPTKTFTLSNGLEVILHKNSTWPLVSAHMLFKDNYFYEVAKEGLPLGIVMPLLMEGSLQFSKHDNVEFFEGHGAQYGFSAGGVYLAGLKTDMAPLFERLLYIIKNPAFPQDALEKLKANQIDSFLYAQQNPQVVGSRLLKNAIYGLQHPFSWTFEEAIEGIKSLSLPEIKSYYKKHVSPANMVLTLSGDFDDAEMQKVITSLFEGWNGTPYEKHEPLKIKNEEKPQNIDHFMLRNQVVLTLGKRSPLTIYDEDLIPVKLLDYIAFGSLGSRLFQLREATGLFYTARGSFAAQPSKEPGFDYLFALVSLDKVDEAEAGIRSIVKELQEKGVTEQELAIARQLYIKSLIDAASSNNMVAATLGMLQTFNLGFDYYDKVLKRVNTISAAELNEIAKKYYSTDMMHRVRVGRVGKEQ